MSSSLELLVFAEAVEGYSHVRPEAYAPLRLQF